MIELLSSKRMTILIVTLISICVIVILIEEWFANNQLTVTPDLSVKEVPTKTQAPVKFSNNFSINVDIVDTHQIKYSGHTNWRSFLSFLSLTSFLGSVSGLLVKFRQKQLRCRSLARFRTPNDDSCHALIDMSNHAY